jgi:hypothetical protein
VVQVRASQGLHPQTATAVTARSFPSVHRVCQELMSIVSLVSLVLLRQVSSAGETKRRVWCGVAEIAMLVSVP